MTTNQHAIVFDVQRFSIHDGPGIRTVVFFKGCGLDCQWCQNPEGRHHAPELSYHADRCIAGCQACLSSCPERALLDQIEDRVVWDKCTNCGECVAPCPSKALTMVGEEWSAQRLLDEVLADAPFYAQTVNGDGGGVTLSGGEPVLHAKFLAEFLPMVKQAGLHVALETSGQYGFDVLEPLLEHVDLVLFDVKAGGRERHLALVGHGDEQIKANLRKLLAHAAVVEGRVFVEVRMPVIPGLNDIEASLDVLCEELRAMGVEHITLLPYNHLWEAKLAHLHTPKVALGLRPPADEHYAEVERRFAARGVAAHMA